MGHDRIYLNRTIRAGGLWLTIVIVLLALGGLDTLLQNWLVAENIAGIGPLMHYLFFLYSPFIISVICGVLFAPMIGYPLRSLLLAQGHRQAAANAICVVVACAGVIVSYWVVLESWVAMRSMLGD